MVPLNVNDSPWQMVALRLPVKIGSSVTDTVIMESHPPEVGIISVPLVLFPLYKVPFTVIDSPLQIVVSKLMLMADCNVIVTDIIESQPDADVRYSVPLVLVFP